MIGADLLWEEKVLLVTDADLVWEKIEFEAWLLQTVHVWQVLKKALIIKKLVLTWDGPIWMVGVENNFYSSNEEGARGLLVLHRKRSNWTQKLQISSSQSVNFGFEILAQKFGKGHSRLATCKYPFDFVLGFHLLTAVRVHNFKFQTSMLRF